ncbi:nucleotide-diphospho-sugar transferase [Polychytrium aggregatum]|uniref:nucleotide-diphospho-sugar transferase n=1 Tax=Polychytrium aggregatum TaxID=110093 RepID=UPI0022FF3EBD|nr:nucleotide-diphospho-sugar transferase [Polychytrium aggregatum]KAI9209169.1 nucleotide-diphospho-sugar transferase [Polychytrium aggregatum]
MSSSRLAVLFLAAGYGSRLQRDIRADASQQYAHLLGIPKALLPLAGKPLIEHWLELFRALPTAITASNGATLEFDATRDCFIICNDFFHGQFQAWAQRPGVGFPPGQILNDGSTSNETRLGAIRDLALAISTFGLHERPVLVVAGDTLFLKSFSLEAFLTAALTRPDSEASLVTCYDIGSEDTRKTGILEIDGDRRVVGFVEKPEPTETTSRLACPCFYFLAPAALRQLDLFLEHKKQLHGGDQEHGSDAAAAVPWLEEIDATGRLLAWLIHQVDVYASEIEGRLDIGGLASYIDAEAYMKSD